MTSLRVHAPRLPSVCDPEIPVLTIADLGVLRSIDVAADGTLDVAITPTYSGCPAMDVIGFEVKMRIDQSRN